MSMSVVLVVQEKASSAISILEDCWAFSPRMSAGLSLHFSQLPSVLVHPGMGDGAPVAWSSDRS